LRTILFFWVPQILKKVHCINCLFEDSIKTGVVTHCYSKIVAKEWAFKSILGLRASVSPRFVHDVNHFLFV
jgi:hypothetical protein